mgnify:CR=1 FL=1|jgi:hypothetical protein
MKVDSLSELKAAFAGWRRGKRHPREAVPDELLERARRAAEVHGVKEVVRVVRVERSRLFRGRREEGASAIPAPVPAFSRLELTAPALGVYPIAEIETPAGIKLRVFAESRAMVGLLSSLCGVGGAK